MAGISSLLRSAAATRAKIQSQQDAVAAFEWQSSAQTYDDYLNYSNYLTDQANKTTDPTQSLSYATKLRSANSSYVGNEIQRQTQSVMEGSSTNQDKYSKLVGFYYQATDAGNYNLAQNLRSQIDSLSITIQNEQQSAQTLARGMAADNVTTIQDYVTAQKDIVKQWGDIYAQYGAEGLNDSLHQYAQQQGLPADPSYFDVISGIIGVPDANGNYAPDSMLGALQTSAAGLDTVNANKLKNDMNQITGGTTKFDLPGIGGVSYSDIIDAVDAQRAGQNIYSIGQDSNGKNVFIKNKLDNYTWGQDSSGQMRLIKTYAPNAKQFDQSTVLNRNAQGQLLDSKGNVTTDASKAARVSYKDLLENAGFKVIGTNSDGSLQVAQGSSAGSNLDVTGGGEFNVVVDDSGNLRFVHTDASGQKHLYEFDIGTFNQDGTQALDKNGNPINEGSLKLRELTADNTSAFGDTGYYKSLPSEQGVQLVKQIIGQQDVNFDPSRPSLISSVIGNNGFAPADVNPYGRALTTSDILRQGSMIQDANTAKALALQASANPQFQPLPTIQASPTINLNQGVVPGGSQGALKVSNAPPAPRLNVTTSPTVPITGVVNAAPKPIQNTSAGQNNQVSVGTGSLTGRVPGGLTVVNR